VGVVVVVVLIAAVAFVAIGTGTRSPGVPGAGLTPAAFLTSATQTTLSHHTADVVFSGSVSAAGTTIPVHGSGQADLTADSFNADVNLDHGGKTLVEQELVVNGHFYMDITEDGQDVASVVPGKHWVEIPLPPAGTSGSLGTGTVDPVTQLQQLAKAGNVIRPLGTSAIQGVTVSGYAITPSRQTIEREMNAEIASGQLSPAARQQLRQSTKDISGFTMEVWFDGSGLMRRMTVDQKSVGPPSTTGHVVMTFENYGTPVTISAPSPGQVISYSDLLAALQTTQGSLT
jgi:hypothetical protein